MTHRASRSSRVERAYYHEAVGWDDLTVLDVPDATLAVGHTWWSTHGLSTNVNVHLHIDCVDDGVVVNTEIVAICV